MSSADLEKVLEEMRARLARIEERLRPQPCCFDFPEAAQRIGIGVTKLREMVARREIRVSTVGRRQMISLSEIERVTAPDEERPRVEAEQREKAWKPLVKPKPPPKR